MRRQTLVRETTMSSALFHAALAIPATQRPGTIANNIVWRRDETRSGLVFETAIKLPNKIVNRS